MPQHERDEEQTGEGNENREDGSHRAAVERHPARRLEQVILKREVSGITSRRTTRIMYEAHTNGVRRSSIAVTRSLRNFTRSACGREG